MIQKEDIKYQLDFKDGVWGVWTESFNWNQFSRLYVTTKILKNVRISDADKEELVLTVHVLEDNIVPVNSCCDTFHK